MMGDEDHHDYLRADDSCPPAQKGPGVFYWLIRQSGMLLITAPCSLFGPNLPNFPSVSSQRRVHPHTATENQLKKDFQPLL
jgi:hypothetical protein